MGARTECQMPGCHRRVFLLVAGVRTCAAHMTAIENTANREANLDHPPHLYYFRFVRRRGGYETWLHEGRGASNLSCSIALRNPDLGIPVMRLVDAQAAARRFAEVRGFPFIDADRCITRDLLRELLRPPASTDA